MKGLIVGCYAIAFSALGLTMVLLMQQTSINANSVNRLSINGFDTLASQAPSSTP